MTNLMLLNGEEASVYRLL